MTATEKDRAILARTGQYDGLPRFESFRPKRKEPANPVVPKDMNELTIRIGEFITPPFDLYPKGKPQEVDEPTCELSAVDRFPIPSDIIAHRYTRNPDPMRVSARYCCLES